MQCLEELSIYDLLPRKCPKCDACAEVDRETGFYECWSCGFSSRRPESFPPDRASHIKLMEGVMQTEGSELVTAIVRSKRCDADDIVRPIGELYDCAGQYNVVREIQNALKELKVVMKELLCHTERPAHPNYNRFCYPMLRDSVVTSDQILRTIAVSMAVDDAKARELLGWAVDNFIKFTRSQHRERRLLHALVRWKSAQDELHLKCAMTTLCDDFVKESASLTCRRLARDMYDGL